MHARRFVQSSHMDVSPNLEPQKSINILWFIMFFSSWNCDFGIFGLAPPLLGGEKPIPSSPKSASSRRTLVRKTDRMRSPSAYHSSNGKPISFPGWVLDGCFNAWLNRSSFLCESGEHRFYVLSCVLCWFLAIPSVLHDVHFNFANFVHLIRAS